MLTKFKIQPVQFCYRRNDIETKFLFYLLIFDAGIDRSRKGLNLRLIFPQLLKLILVVEYSIGRFQQLDSSSPKNRKPITPQNNHVRSRSFNG